MLVPLRVGQKSFSVFYIVHVTARIIIYHFNWPAIRSSRLFKWGRILAHAIAASGKGGLVNWMEIQETISIQLCVPLINRL